MSKSENRISIRDSFDISLENLPLNENFVVLGLKALRFGEQLQGASATKYFCYCECGSTNKVNIQVFSFEESLGIQDLKKGQRFFVKGKINYYRHPKTKKEYHSVFVEEIFLKRSN